jgi:ABC-2 type transport system ATP-binding protein
MDNYSVVLDAVSKKLKGAMVLNDINLSFEPGAMYGLYGKNGSGKTMLLRMIAGLIRPTDGRVLIQGRELHREIDFPESIGIVIETPDFWHNYTGLNVLMTLARIKGLVSIKEMRETLERVGLDPDDTRTVRKYSLGMKQRLGIAQAIMERPDILLLDEPTNALDKVGVKLAERIIKEESVRGATVIIASHDQNDLDNCDRLVGLEAGYVI